MFNVVRGEIYLTPVNATSSPAPLSPEVLWTAYATSAKPDVEIVFRFDPQDVQRWAQRAETLLMLYWKDCGFSVNPNNYKKVLSSMARTRRVNFSTSTKVAIRWRGQKRCVITGIVGTTEAMHIYAACRGAIFKEHYVNGRLDQHATRGRVRTTEEGAFLRKLTLASIENGMEVHTEAHKVLDTGELRILPHPCNFFDAEGHPQPYHEVKLLDRPVALKLICTSVELVLDWLDQHLPRDLILLQAAPDNWSNPHLQSPTTLMMLDACFAGLLRSIATLEFKSYCRRQQASIGLAHDARHVYDDDADAITIASGESDFFDAEEDEEEADGDCHGHMWQTFKHSKLPHVVMWVNSLPGTTSTPSEPAEELGTMVPLQIDASPGERWPVEDAAPMRSPPRWETKLKGRGKS